MNTTEFELKAWLFDILWPEIVKIAITSGLLEPEFVAEELGKKFRSAAEKLGNVDQKTFVFLIPELKKLLDHMETCDTATEPRGCCYNEATFDKVILCYLLAKEIGWILSGVKKVHRVRAETRAAKLLGLKENQAESFEKEVFLRSFYVLPKNAQKQILRSFKKKAKKRQKC